ncbi:hypothetical protein SAMN06269185_2902 [Natronoarchaeum philippinense]|uniref:Uncharacterized protein n=1 Tax=Natronoarchaeum philippinense TaxID=558529 RepID=A0A285P5W7_NATPI|nr:hypothetical protein [Natronoarchaeum philippinense]SNZ17159.1 hypothetical protein SAMN06269185_2902 [Natronoarchaeum philippinense]
MSYALDGKIDDARRLLGCSSNDRTWGRTERGETREIDALGGELIAFSLDGEIVSTPSLDIAVDPGRLSLFVGEGYDPEPTA